MTLLKQIAWRKETPPIQRHCEIIPMRGVDKCRVGTAPGPVP